MFEVTILRASIRTAVLFLMALWLIKSGEVYFHIPLSHWGITPRSVEGIPGILLAPLLHGSWWHLFSNSLPLLVLGVGVLYGYPRARWRTISVIWLVTGVGVWLFARESIHLGASGLGHGLFFFLFIAGILRRDKRSIALLMIAFLLYGSMLLTILPQQPAISFESHAFGALGGIISAVLFHHRDPPPARRVYDWELEPDE